MPGRFETGAVARARAALLATVIVALPPGRATASQPDLSSVQLRLLNSQQSLELAREQRDLRAGLHELAPAEREPLKQRLDRQKLDQRALQQRQLRRQRALRQQLGTLPAARAGSPLSRQLQGFKRQQRQQQLRFGVQRRSWQQLRR